MKKILVLSGKGGTGKTTVASSFIQLAQSKAYADCDVDAPNLQLLFSKNRSAQKEDFFGMPKAEINPDKCISCGLCAQHCRFGGVVKKGDHYEIDRFQCEGCKLCMSLCPNHAIEMTPEVSGTTELYCDDNGVFSTARLRMGSGNSGKLVTQVKQNLYAHANEDEKLVIIDGSPGIGCPVIASISGADMVLIVAEPSLSGMSDMERIVATAKQFHSFVAICVNKYDVNEENSAKIEQYCIDNQIPFVGRIPFDKMATVAVNNGQNVVEYDCAAADGIRKVYENCVVLLK